MALVSADAEHYRRSFARLLSRDAKPLFSGDLSLVTLVPQSQVNLLTQKVHRRCAGRVNALVSYCSAWAT